MARVALAIQQLAVSTPLSTITFTAPNGIGAGNGNTVATFGNPLVFLLVKNLTGTGARTITIPNAQSLKIPGTGITPASQTLTANQTQMSVFQLAPSTYLDASGNIDVDIDSLDAGNVTWAAIQIAVNPQ